MTFCNAVQLKNCKLNKKRKSRWKAILRPIVPVGLRNRLEQPNRNKNLKEGNKEKKIRYRISSFCWG
jgi:hypothetical protein